jgi:hypothetical protein
MDIESIRCRTAEIERLSREDRIKLREETINKNRLLGDYAIPCTLPVKERPSVKEAIVAKQRIEGSGTKMTRVTMDCPDWLPTARKTLAGNRSSPPMRDTRQPVLAFALQG